MKPIPIKIIPPVAFEEISIHMPDWQNHFLNLVQDVKPIKYRVYSMPNLSKDIQDELSKRRYCHMFLESDPDQYFLVPPQR